MERAGERLAAAVMLLWAGAAGFLGAADPPPLAQAPFDAKQAGEFQEQWAEHLGRERVVTNSIGMRMVLIPPGEFLMGIDEETMRDLVPRLKQSSNIYERGSWVGLFNEMPAHQVRITKPFCLGETEVTVAQFRRFAEESGYRTEAERGLVYGKPSEKKLRTWRDTFYQQADDHPVLQLGWRDCVEFCRWLSEKEAEKGVEYHLPTEAQWEYACRAGTTTAWHFGGPDDYDRVAPEYSWSSWDAKKTPTPIAVGQKKPNAFGLYDMHGNIWEYAADWIDEYYYLESPVNDPAGPPTFNEIRDGRVLIRGGSFDCGHYWSRATMRIRIRSDSNQHPHMGFRVAMRIKGVEGVSPAPEPNMRVVRSDADSGPFEPADPVAAQKDAVTGDRPAKLAVELGSGTQMELVLIPAGRFLMGSLKGGRYERPVHEVAITKPFYLGKTEVTQGQWDAVMGEADRLSRWGKFKPRPASTGPENAMMNVHWEDIREFLSKLSAKLAGSGGPIASFALPTEAQWEYACRAGSATEYHYGDDPAKLAEYALVCADDALHPRDRPDAAFDTRVGRRKPNAWGLHDMHGNVHEYCADWFGKDFYSRSPLENPRGPESGYARILRGGSFGRYGRFARSAYRFFALPGAEGRSGRIGFRVVGVIAGRGDSSGR